MKKAIAVLIIVLSLFSLVVCTPADNKTSAEAKSTAPENASKLDDSSNRVVIYSGAEEYRNEYFMKRLKEQFPEYEKTFKCYFVKPDDGARFVYRTRISRI